MSRNLVAALICISLLLLQAAFIVAVEWVPGFYSAKLQVTDEQNAAMGASLKKVFAKFQQQVGADGPWQLRISDAEINGWLAVELPKQTPQIMPDTMKDPRVAFAPDMCRIACQFHDMGTRAVLNMSINVTPTEFPNEIRLRVLEATVGAVPGLEPQAVGPIGHAAWRSGIRMKWLESEQHPEAVASLPPDWLGSNRILHVDTVEFGDGQVVIRGRSETVPIPKSRTQSADALTPPRNDSFDKVTSSLKPAKVKQTARRSPPRYIKVGDGVIRLCSGHARMNATRLSSVHVAKVAETSPFDMAGTIRSEPESQRE